MATQVKSVEINATKSARKPQVSRPVPVILVVEDDPVVRQFLETALRGFDFEVRLASNGQEALDVYRHGAIDLVLMGVQMPILDGPKTLARLKDLFPDVVCCFMSAHTGNYAVDEIVGMGAVGFLQKPCHLEELRQAVMDAVG